MLNWFHHMYPGVENIDTSSFDFNSAQRLLLILIGKISSDMKSKHSLLAYCNVAILIQDEFGYLTMSDLQH